ncbi:hypothetical protein ABZX85_09745 [Streptomyces sp. NPDC004539]|uniref:hypothetical protein n=1 Tax=Streptomyces sp. NPDC004539 TaxID=3154280 RepID=UPI0033A5618A
MKKIKIEDLPVWEAEELSLGAKLLWLCNFRSADIESETARGILALLAETEPEPEAYESQLLSAGWATRYGKSLRSVVPATF